MIQLTTIRNKGKQELSPNSFCDLKLRKKVFVFIASNKNFMLQDVCCVRATELKAGENVNQINICCCK